LGNLERRRTPHLTPAINLLFRNLHINSVDFSVDVNYVAILDKGDWTTHLGFGDNMTDNEAMGAEKERLVSGG